MISILIAEDHSMVQVGIRALLEKVWVLNILGEAANGQEAVEQIVIESTFNPHKASRVENLKVRNIAGLVRLAVKYWLIHKET